MVCFTYYFHRLVILLRIINNFRNVPKQTNDCLNQVGNVDLNHCIGIMFKNENSEMSLSTS